MNNQKREETFYQKYPAYKRTTLLDELREKDFATLDATHEIYLDYTGGGLYGASQIDEHMAFLKSAVFGNPHSDNPTSLRSTVFADNARTAVLDFFHANPNEYVVIFTPNASGALRLIGESYPFEKDGRFLQLMDNHNSVTGIREYARRAATPIRTIKSRRSDLHVTKASVTQALADHTSAPHLFAYPAQSNFSGVQHSLEWIEAAHKEDWDVLLDAAAFVPTNALDLSKVRPDFVALSFYKMFGWPTGVGCLLARKGALAKLRRPWFAGGTIWALSVQGDWHIMAPEYEAFEDGTINYLNLPAVQIGLEYLTTIGINTIHTRVMCLTGWLLDEFATLYHKNGQPLVVVYGPATTKERGAIIACNFLDDKARIIDERAISRTAKEQGISLRTGCFCNPGAGEITFELSPQRLTAARDDGSRKNFDHYLSYLGLPSGGAIRLSFGLASNFADAEALLAFVRSLQDTSLDTTDLPPRNHC